MARRTDFQSVNRSSILRRGTKNNTCSRGGTVYASGSNPGVPRVLWVQIPPGVLDEMRILPPRRREICRGVQPAETFRWLETQTGLHLCLCRAWCKVGTEMETHVLVVQQAETTGLNPVQCAFESRRGHLPINRVDHSHNVWFDIFAEWSSLVARNAHAVEAVGSNPTSATNRVVLPVGNGRKRA